jgi:DNA recombination-dependent growth factor C
VVVKLSPCRAAELLYFNDQENSQIMRQWVSTKQESKISKTRLETYHCHIKPTPHARPLIQAKKQDLTREQIADAHCTKEGHDAPL